MTEAGPRGGSEETEAGPRGGSASSLSNVLPGAPHGTMSVMYSICCAVCSIEKKQFTRECTNCFIHGLPCIETIVDTKENPVEYLSSSSL